MAEGEASIGQTIDRANAIDSTLTTGLNKIVEKDLLSTDGALAQSEKRAKATKEWADAVARNLAKKEAAHR